MAHPKAITPVSRATLPPRNRNVIDNSSKRSASCIEPITYIAVEGTFDLGRPDPNVPLMSVRQLTNRPSLSSKKRLTRFVSGMSMYIRHGVIPLTNGSSLRLSKGRLSYSPFRRLNKAILCAVVKARGRFGSASANSPA